MNQKIIEAVSDFRKACVECGMMGQSPASIDAVMSAQVELFEAIAAEGSATTEESSPVRTDNDGTPLPERDGE